MALYVNLYQIMRRNLRTSLWELLALHHVWGQKPEINRLPNSSVSRTLSRCLYGPDKIPLAWKCIVVALRTECWGQAAGYLYWATSGDYGQLFCSYICLGFIDLAEQGYFVDGCSNIMVFSCLREMLERNIECTGIQQLRDQIEIERCIWLILELLSRSIFQIRIIL